MSNIIAKPECPTKCGDVTIPYPFGIVNDTGCFLNSSFNVTCNMSENPPKLFLGSSNIQILDISDSELRIPTKFAYSCYNRDGSLDARATSSISFERMPDTYTFSEKNMLAVIGCDDYALITHDDVGDDNIYSGCIGLCSASGGQANASDGRCSGYGCCQTSIPYGLNFFNVQLKSFKNHTKIWSDNACGYGFVGEAGSFKFSANDLVFNSGFENRVKETVPVVIDWVINGYGSCGSEATECKKNSHCYDGDYGGYRCKCDEGYEGNPYLDQGCQDFPHPAEWADKCVNQIESCYQQKDQLNDNIIATMKDCLVSFSKIYKTEKEMAAITRASLEEEIEVIKKVAEEAYEELDVVKKKFQTAQVDLVYLRGLVTHFKNKYPEEKRVWKFVDEEE